MKSCVLSLILLSAPAFAAESVGMSEADLKKQNARFAPVELTADLSRLPENELAALANIVRAAKIMDTLFLRQVWAGNETLLLELIQDTSPLGKARLEAFLLNKGPWSRLDHAAPFIPGVPARLPQANFYPMDVTKAEVDAWQKSLPEAERQKATGFFSTIRKAPDGKLRFVWYSTEYQGELMLAAKYLREAAKQTREPTLKKFLETRAAAFMSNDYYASDVAWMELNAPVEPTIGPYEVYEDEWFNAKAAFESFVTLRDDAETQKLAKFSSELQGLENALPIDAKYKNTKLGALAPIRVVNSIFSSGDANRGVQTAAFNLPNDERVAKEKGTKRVMLKNVQEAKFKMVLLPITKVALASADQKKVSFDAFFTHILMHELMHGLGPHEIKVGDKATTVRAELTNSYSAIEEAKADISGLWALQHLIDKGVVDKSLEQTLYTTYLASMFRSIRFGVNEAHGKGVAMQLNYLLDAGAFVVAKGGTFGVDASKIKDAVKNLTSELLTIQARGDSQKAQEILARLAVVRPEVQSVLDKLAKVPVDIAPRYVTAETFLKDM